MQSKKLTHGYSKPHNKERMVKYDPENAQAWAVIMNKIRQEYATGSTQLSIAKKLGVTKVAVSRWLSEDRGGERTTFGDMLRYAKALDISYDELIGRTSTIASSYDKAVGCVLEEFARDTDMPSTDIAAKSGLSTTLINNIFAGKINIDVSALNAICTAIEANANHVLKRASKKLEQE